MTTSQEEDRKIPKWVRAALILKPLPTWTPATFAVVQAVAIVSGLVLEIWIAGWETNWKYLAATGALSLLLLPVGMEAAYAYLARGRLTQQERVTERFLEDLVVASAESVVRSLRSEKRKHRTIPAEGIRALAPVVLVRDAEASYAEYRTASGTYRGGPRGGSEEAAAASAFERETQRALSPEPLTHAVPVELGGRAFGELVVVTWDSAVGPVLRSRANAAAALLAAVEAAAVGYED